MPIAELGKARYVALTTFKRDGTPVTTAVWCASDDGRLLVWTGAATGKVKRIRHDAHVTVAPSGASGSPRGEAVDGVAEIVGETAEIEALLRRKYGAMYRAVRAANALVRAVRRRPAEPSVTLVIRDR
jgi:PPOX class probable F420-dependent enzyme